MMINIENYKVLTADPTAYYVSEFISASEEKVILSNIYGVPKPKWTQLSNRRLQNWGGMPHNKGMVAETIPPWLDKYLQRIHNLNLMDDKRPNHVLINEYLAGQGIMPHLDGNLFHSTITTISVGSHTILNFFKPATENELVIEPVFSFLLEPRSLLVLQDKLFSYYLHGIEEIYEDTLDKTVVNLSMCSDKYVKGSTIKRDTRISLTIRHVPKTTSFKINIGNRSCCSVEHEIKIGQEKQLDGNQRALVVGLYESKKTFELTPAAEELDQKSGGKIIQHLNELAPRLKLGKAFVLTDVLPEYSAVALASLGPKNAGYNDLESLDETRENVRWGVGAGVRLLKKRGNEDILVDPAGAPDAAAEAAELAAWRFQEFRSDENRLPKTKVSLHGKNGEDLWTRGSIYARAQNWARYLSDMPANVMTPVDLAQAALDMLCPLGVQVEARDREWIEAQNMQAFLAVARGSCETPIFLECIYKGGKKDRPPLLIAAKGVTFDSGGLCLKERKHMMENRGSMAGAAVALAALKIIAELKIPINVCAVIPICENMVSGQCMKVGDVVTALNGMSIQIEDTDMEGRLIMADALVYGQTIHHPSLVIDVATLTHGVLLATGGGAFGCFSNSDEAWNAIKSAGAITGDRPWRFPLWTYYENQIINNPFVDLRNKGAGKATPCLGAAFLRKFVCCDWLHMDITGVGKVAHAPAPPYLDAARMSGRPARTLALLLHNIAESCEGYAPTTTDSKIQ